MSQGYYDTSYPPDLWLSLPDSTTDGRDSASTGDAFFDDDITAQDSANAGKLTGLGFVADPQTTWTTGQAIFVNANLRFHWTGTAWAPGISAAGAQGTQEAPVVPQEAPEAPQGTETAQEPPEAPQTP